MHFPGQEHLKTTGTTKPSVSANHPAGKATPAVVAHAADPNPVVRRISALKAAQEHLQGGSVESLIDAARKIDDFLIGKRAEVAVNVVNPAGATEIAAAATREVLRSTSALPNRNI